MRYLLTYLTLFLFAFALAAEETIVVGTVTDAVTGRPIENANVWYRNTDIGCATNTEGLYMIRTDLDKKRTLQVSAVGYKKRKFQIEPGQYVGIEIELEEENTILEDVFILPGENPALALMKQVRTHRAENDLLTHPSTDFSSLQQKELYISDIRQKHLERMLFKSLRAGMLSADDSTLLLPLYLSHSVCRTTNGRKQLLGQPQEKSIFMTETDYSVLLDGLPDHFDFYQNSISVFSHNFISPLARSANNHYKFYLADSLMLDSIGKTYIVHFRSKNPYEPSFNGELLIDSARCAIRKIDVSVPREVGINYLTSLRISQTYNEHLLPATEDMSMIFDFAIKADTSHLFPTVLLKRNTTTLQVFYSDKEQYTDVAYPTVPIDSVSVYSSEADSAMAMVENSPIVRVAKFIAHIINTGNITTGEKVDIGNVVEVVGYSQHEGLNLGVPLTTNEQFSKHVELSAYTAYGFHDRAFKGKGQVKWLLPTERRHLLGAYYWDRYVKTDISDTYAYFRENSVFYGTQDITYMLFSGISYQQNPANASTRRREFKLWTENDWTDNIETMFAFSVGRMGYGSPYVGYNLIPSYRFRTIEAMVRIGFDERKTDVFVRRYRLHSHKPILRFMVEIGTWQLDKQYGVPPNYYEQGNLYARLTLQLQQTISLGTMGRLDYSAQAGLVFGQVPYPLLEHFVGNSTYTYDPYRFTLMNQYQYAADKYIYAHLHWNMQGALFNKIPYVQRLHLRELIEAKIAYGTFDNKHADVVALPEGLQSMRVPYIETGIGIGNILRVADLYAVFRLTDLKNTTTPWWAIRARFSLGL